MKVFKAAAQLSLVMCHGHQVLPARNMTVQLMRQQEKH